MSQPFVWGYIRHSISRRTILPNYSGHPQSLNRSDVGLAISHRLLGTSTWITTRGRGHSSRMHSAFCFPRPQSVSASSGKENFSRDEQLRDLDSEQYYLGHRNISKLMQVYWHTNDADETVCLLNVLVLIGMPFPSLGLDRLPARPEESSDHV